MTDHTSNRAKADLVYSWETSMKLASPKIVLLITF